MKCRIIANYPGRPNVFSGTFISEKGGEGGRVRKGDVAKERKFRVRLWGWDYIGGCKPKNEGGL